MEFRPSCILPIYLFILSLVIYKYIYTSIYDWLCPILGLACSISDRYLPRHILPTFCTWHTLPPNYTLIQPLSLSTSPPTHISLPLSEKEIITIIKRNREREKKNHNDNKKKHQGEREKNDHDKNKTSIDLKQVDTSAALPLPSRSLEMTSDRRQKNSLTQLLLPRRL